jgi:glycosyltransferase involved in cell wall biosynthesis
MTEVAHPPVDILLATYNGGKFLGKQLDSLAKQSYQNWHLIIRDDGSSDQTLRLLNEFRGQHVSRVNIINDGKGSLGASQNFSELLSHSRSDYITFCDQDDVWLPHKIELSLQNVLELERAHGKNTPVLVYSDLQVVDEKLNLINNSFWQHQHINPDQGQAWNRLLIDNVVTGCASMFNRSLLVVASPVPKEAILHDWWFALAASLFGVMKPINQPTILYRQHISNVRGASKKPKRSFQSVTSHERRQELWEELRLCQAQAKILVHNYAKRIEPEKLSVIRKFSELDTLSFLERKVFLARHSILKSGLLRNVALLLRL